MFVVKTLLAGNNQNQNPRENVKIWLDEDRPSTEFDFNKIFQLGGFRQEPSRPRCLNSREKTWKNNDSEIFLRSNDARLFRPCFLFPRQYVSTLPRFLLPSPLILTSDSYRAEQREILETFVQLNQPGKDQHFPEYLENRLICRIFCFRMFNVVFQTSVSKRSLVDFRCKRIKIRSKNRTLLLPRWVKID